MFNSRYSEMEMNRGKKVLPGIPGVGVRRRARGHLRQRVDQTRPDRATTTAKMQNAKSLYSSVTGRTGVF